MNLPRWKTHASGLETILVQKNDSPIVKINLIFRYGSYEDPKHKDGLANFVGDMLLRGSTSKSREQIEFALDHLGASLNIYSGYHSLVMEGRVLTKNFDKLIHLMKELLTSPVFDESEIQKLKNEIKSDLLLRLEDDQDLAKHHFFKEIYGSHLYSRDAIGTAQTTASFEKSELSASLPQLFNHTGMLIAAAGDLMPDRFEKVANDFYALFPSNPKPPTVSPFTSKTTGKEIVLIDKPDLTQTQFFIGHSCISAKSEDLIPLDVFVTAFAGSMFQAKYMQEIRVKRGWSYGAYGSIDARRDGGSFYLYTFPKNDDTVDAIEVSLDLFGQAIEGTLLDESSIEFSKNYLARSYPFKIDTPEKIMGQKIYNKMLNKPEEALEQYRSKVHAVDYAKALATAQKYLSNENLKIVMVCTASLFEDKLNQRIKPADIKIKKYNEI